MRSLLFVPGDSARKLEKAMSSGADALLIDLEDSVALSAKDEARRVTAGFLREAGQAPNRPRLFVRVNGLTTGLTEADLDGVTVIVADSGAGIEKKQLRRLGSPFALVVEDHFSKSRKGSGLGLALSRSLMELQGGILAIASQPGRGTVACATFPRRKDAKVRLPQFIRPGAHVLTGQRAEHMHAASQAAE